VAVGDFNGDGKPDLAVANLGDNNVSVLLNTTVSNTAPTITRDQATVTVDEGQTAANSGTYSDLDSANVTLTASVGTVTKTGTNSGTWSWSFGTSDGPAQSQTVTITATDSQGATSTTTFALIVNNVAPTVGTITASLAPVQVNTAISTSATFADVGTLDTHTATWNWGDGTSPGTITESNGSGSVTGTHTYANPGVYTVTLTVYDDDTGSVTSTFQYVVVYDPSGGFVTGGGWIDSPAGAYVADASLTGKATFGFVSKYLPGATVPSGNTEFQFKAGTFNFKSASYEWLVVAGPKAMYKGTGTVNGAGSYSFQLTAWDGQAPGGGGTDRFRIRIWNNTGNTLVYDNQVGDANPNADPITAVVGSIVIHKGSPLQAAALPAPGAAPDGLLTSEQLQPLLDEALVRWEAAGLTAAQLDQLRGVQVQITNLGDNFLGMEQPGAVWIDDDAAGWGWFVDVTPWDDSEFTTAGDQGEQGRMDLLTTVMHELGHILGLPDLDPDQHAGSLMAATLTTGTRRVPEELQPDGVLKSFTITAPPPDAPAPAAVPLAVVLAPDGGPQQPLIHSTAGAEMNPQAALPGGLVETVLPAGGGHDVLLGGDGDDLQVGGDGRDFLLGGLGSDRLAGSADEGYLIAAAHDDEAVPLAVTAGWAATGDHTARDAGTYLAGAAVSADGAEDARTGSAGADWFFAHLDAAEGDRVTDLSASGLAEDLGFIHGV
jgi:hypothetical protein